MPESPAFLHIHLSALGLLGLLIATEASALAGPPKHPYLFFSAEDLPALRRKLETEPFASRFRTLLANADEHLERGRRSRRFRGRGARSALGRIGTLSFAYVVTGDREYGLRAKEDMIDMLSASTWHRRAAGSDAQLYTGESSVAFALFYDWCNDLLSEEEKAEMRAKFIALSTRIYMESVQKDQWWVNNPVTNWCGAIHGGCGLGALAIAAESPVAAETAEVALKHVQAFLRQVTLQDGAGYEGVMYWRYGMNFGNYLAYAASRVQGDDAGLYADWTEKCVGYWDIYMRGPDGAYANFNNMHEGVYRGLYSENGRAEAGPDAPLHALLESKVPGGDPLLLWAADHGGAKYYWKGTSPFWFIWRRETPPMSQRPALDPAVLFRGNGHAVFRSDRLWLAFNGGWTSNRSHSNRDLGSFVFVVDGERMVHDPGYGRSSAGEHSTVVVKGRNQESNVRGRYLRFGSGEGFHYLACDLSEVYGPGVLERFVRHVVMVDGRYVVILDELAAPGPAQFEWRLQTRREIEVDPGDPRAVLHGERSDLHVIAAGPEGVVADTDRASLPFVRFRPPAPVGKTTIVTVLVPTAPGGSAPEVLLDTTQGILTVRDAEGNADELRFDHAGLASINGHSAEKIGPPSGRTFTVYRKADAQ